MKPLVLVKHSLSEVQENVSARDWLLSEEGRERAQRLAKVLKRYHPEVILSSTEPKARETASILAESLGLNFDIVAGLHEHDRSNSPYYSREEFQVLVQELFKNPDALIFGAETASQALKRFRDSVNLILQRYKDMSVLIVAHGTVLSLYTSGLTGCDGYILWSELGLPSFVVLDLESKALLETVNLP
jgi:broad specificity phosphatase PhoE